MLKALNSQGKPYPITRQSTDSYSAKLVNPPNIYHHNTLLILTLSFPDTFVPQYVGLSKPSWTREQQGWICGTVLLSALADKMTQSSSVAPSVLGRRGAHTQSSAVTEVCPVSIRQARSLPTQTHWFTSHILVFLNFLCPFIFHYY